MRKYVSNLKLKSKYHKNTDSYKKAYKEMRQALLEGHQLVVYVGVGGSKSSWKNFTSSGYHFISVLGIDEKNNKVFVGNPGLSYGWYDLSTVVKARRTPRFWLEIYK